MINVFGRNCRAANVSNWKHLGKLFTMVCWVQTMFVRTQACMDVIAVGINIQIIANISQSTWERIKQLPEENRNSCWITLKIAVWLRKDEIWELLWRKQLVSMLVLFFITVRNTGLCCTTKKPPKNLEIKIENPLIDESQHLFNICYL